MDSTNKKSSTLTKVVIALLAADFACIGGCLLIYALGEPETAFFAEVVGTFFLACSYIFLTAIVAIGIYTIVMKMMAKDNSNKQSEVVPTILQGITDDQEKAIIALLKTVAHPLPGKTKLNRARTAQFLRALIESGYIDKNTDEKIMMVWVETVTEFKDGDPGHFKKAIKDTYPKDPKVAFLREQIEQIVSK